ncbi:MAG: acyltransferase [Lachnospiraceae bacterium]|nr:acyltransferase [Lachnospiraceae bacterium]
MIIIDPAANISAHAIIEDSKKGTEIRIGGGGYIDVFVLIRPVGGIGDIRIGERCYINCGTVIYSGNGITLGNDVLIGPNCTLSGSNHEYRKSYETVYDQRFAPSKGGIIIEDDVWIGSNCSILDGAILRKGAIIGANSLVNKEVPPNAICYGSPAKVVGFRQGDEEAAKYV